MTRFKLAALATFMLTAAAVAQSIAPGAEGPLKDILPPEPGTQICFARTYDAAHLAKHPKQKVTDIKFHLAYHRHDPDEGYPEGQRNYYFALLAKRRGESQFATAFGECSTYEGKIRCGVDCDGGGVNIEKAGEGLGISFGDSWGISLTNECGSGDVAAPALEPGDDDKEFRLTKSDDCPKYEDW
jgi:hypothetical protein